MAPQAGLEPATDRLTAECSTNWATGEHNNSIKENYKKNKDKLEARSGIEPLCKALQAPT